MNPSIPLSECKHGGLYRIWSRNLSLGVFNSANNGFIGIREKFDKLFLDTEYHRDIGTQYGTVVPKEYLEDCPILPISEHLEMMENGRYLANNELFAWLQYKGAQCGCSKRSGFRS